MESRLKKVVSIVLSVVLWVVILIAALFAFTTLATKDPNHVSNVLGYTPLSVQTDSMKPTFSAGDLIIIKKCDPYTLKEGDIVTYHTIIQDQYVLNTHRIQSIEEKYGYLSIITKGDNNPVEDENPITNLDVVGRYVTHIPLLGKVMDFLQSSIGFLICILLPMLAFFIFQIYNLIVIATKYKKASAIEAAEETAKRQAQINSSFAEEENERLKIELEEAKRKLEQNDISKTQTESEEIVTYEQITEAYSKLMMLYNLADKNADQIEEYNRQLTAYQHMLEVYQRSQQ